MVDLEIWNGGRRKTILITLSFIANAHDEFAYIIVFTGKYDLLNKIQRPFFWGEGTDPTMHPMNPAIHRSVGLNHQNFGPSASKYPMFERPIQGRHLGGTGGSTDPQGFLIQIFPCKLYLDLT